MAATTCVSAIPWAQADLNATARTALARDAVERLGYLFDEGLEQ